MTWLKGFWLRLKFLLFGEQKEDVVVTATPEPPEEKPYVSAIEKQSEPRMWRRKQHPEPDIKVMPTYVPPHANALREPVRREPPRRPYYQPERRCSRERRDDGPGFGTGVAIGLGAGLLVGNNLLFDDDEEDRSIQTGSFSPPEDTYQGGSSGGGGTTRSWDSEPTYTPPTPSYSRDDDDSGSSFFSSCDSGGWGSDDD